MELVCRLYGEIPEDNPELEIIRGDDDTEKFTAVLDRFLETVQTPPFLFPRKSVWLKHFNKFDDAFAESSSKKQKSRIDLLSDFLKNGETIPELDLALPETFDLRDAGTAYATAVSRNHNTIWMM